MGRYKIEFSNNAAKYYKKLPKKYKDLVDMALTKISEGKQLDIKPIIGEKDVYRIRIGKYRILFIKITNTILIIKIGSRGDVYK